MKSLINIFYFGSFYVQKYSYSVIYSYFDFAILFRTILLLVFDIIKPMSRSSIYNIILF